MDMVAESYSDANGKVFTCAEIDHIGAILHDQTQPLKLRFRALFALKNIGGVRAVELICDVLDCDPSALLKHELAYCLGQMRDVAAVPRLVKTLINDQQEPIVRHEAGEALAAIGDPCALQHLQQFASDVNTSKDVRETCQLAVAKFNWQQSISSKEEKLSNNPYRSVDPAPPFALSEENVGKLEQMLLDEKLSLWERYRSMFTLRNLGTDDAIQALAKGLSCEDSALFRHEVAYVLGQMQSPSTVRALKSRLVLPAESGMVRHECAEALGSIGSEECVEILKEYLNDSERVVRESCEVALDMADYENSFQLQYATVT